MPDKARNDTYPVRMSSFKHPVGSKPPSVYWRRRALVLGALVVLLLVIVLIAVRPGAGTSASPTPSPSASAAASTKASPAPAASSKPSAAAAPKPSATAAPSGTCDAAQISLKPIADASSYSSLEQPKISMSITNTSTTACALDLGSAEQVLSITSGAETYWSSKDCQVAGTHQKITITAGQTLKTPAITWDRTRSSTKTCDSSRSSVPAEGASYHLSVSVGAIDSSTTALMILN
ncbi:hypothetical protein EDF46_2669 [Frondihabitans sp. PhB188]|uniref:hypothetical protein n=1 Tax=Frondihabitans sp. PhB188 TaxID=2485200 RepID=UPI000F496D5B|nr:hypothetical protein [Frondihabitans sp. PhB188]ROQ37216.1 hypothetical protein EDF46_2669 [Frondihabitans sp. PhB188]